MKKSNFTEALVLLNGDLGDTSHVKHLVSDTTLILAADGGANLANKLGVIPHVIIGDFDSIDDEVFHRFQYHNHSIELQKFPADKDETDSELALNYLLKTGVKHVIVSGFQGSRIDHMLGNLFLLRKFYAKFDDLRIIEGNQEIYLIADQATIHGSKGDTISFMPIAGEVVVKASSGLAYDLSKYVISQIENPGISNVMTHSMATIDITEGQLLVIRTIS